MVPDLPYTVTLRDGAEILVREIGPEDRCLLVEGYAELSPNSRFMRFLGAHGDLSEAEIDQFTAASTPDHFAIGALEDGAPVATARFVRDEPGGAELAVTILDDWQRRGLGKHLMDTLVAAAEARGLTRLNALVHKENDGMQHLLRRFGAKRTGFEGSEHHFTLPLNQQIDRISA